MVEIRCVVLKIKKLAEKLPAGSAGLVTSEESILYLMGFQTDNGYLLVTKDNSYFMTDSRYIEAARQQIKDCEIICGNDLFEVFSDILLSLHIERLFVEATRLNVLTVAKYKERFAPVELVYTDELDCHIKALRKIKSEEEKDKIISAQRIAEQAFLKVLDIIKPGVCERDIAAELEYYMRRGGAYGISFDTIVVTGSNSSKPHGVPGNTKIALGDFVTIDFGAVYEGYHSDTTRTVAVGNPSDEMRLVYDTVLKAQTAGVDAVKSGMCAKDADAVCRNIIEEAGYGDAFGHGTGHGVGVEIHEAPTISPRSTETLQEGNVITVEPGIYLPGEFGVRIEDMLYVTKTGSENLVTLQKELIIL